MLIPERFKKLLTRKDEAVEELAELAAKNSSSKDQAEKTLTFLGLPEENIQFFLEEAKA
ncbi:hypothetical protein L6252_03445 [Candidatus Parcubacteria bacterium]|nr:hypothetical protein [Candidatus Parcubacteria bacterium]